MGYILHGVKDSGAAIVEMVLAMSGLPYSTELTTWDEMRHGEAYGRINPLRQSPVFELPSGELMTESLAIATYICETAGLDLVPPPGSPERARYLRWSTYLVASIYPTFTFADVPARYVSTSVAQTELKNSIGAFRERMWLHMEAAAAPEGPFFLGARRSLIDVFLAVMTGWTPREEWFARHAPRLLAVARLLQLRDLSKT